MLIEHGADLTAQSKDGPGPRGHGYSTSVDTTISLGLGVTTLPATTATGK